MQPVTFRDTIHPDLSEAPENSQTGHPKCRTGRRRVPNARLKVGSLPVRSDSARTTARLITKGHGSRKKSN
jgi:hypothetical protein